MNFSFLKSVRFWKLFIVATAQFLASQAILNQDFANALSLWLGASVGLGTIDKVFSSLKS